MVQPARRLGWDDTMTIKYFATVRDYTGETARRLDGGPACLGDLLDVLCRRYGVLFRRAVLDGERLSPQIIILVNGRNVLHLRGLDTPLADEDEISIFPMVAGG